MKGDGHYKKACAGDEKPSPSHRLMSNRTTNVISTNDYCNGTNIVSDKLYSREHKAVPYPFSIALSSASRLRETGMLSPLIKTILSSLHRASRIALRLTMKLL